MNYIHQEHYLRVCFQHDGKYHFESMKAGKFYQMQIDACQVLFMFRYMREHFIIEILVLF